MFKKRWVIFLVLVMFLLIGCEKEIEIIPKHRYEDLLSNITDSIDISKYTIYGIHFNLEGILPEDGNYEIVLKSDNQELNYDLFIDNFNFKTNEYINTGINLENIPIDNYLILLKNTDTSKYYNLLNKTEYDDLEYYTITKDKKNNLIKIKFDNYENKNYMALEVSETTLPDDVYDIVIDPGHGGNDSGAVNGKYKESTLNLENAKALKEALEKSGYKVRLTRDIDIALKHYGYDSRTSVPYDTKAKLMFSIHLNSGHSSYNGVEVYTASGDKIDFAKKIADNIVKNTSSDYSINTYNRVSKGVYTRIYKDSDIKSVYNQAIREKWTPYDIKENTTYYYFIRETGGIVTKAFADGRNPNYEPNLYYNSNVGVETYLLELGYISNMTNLQKVLNEKDAYIESIKISIDEYVRENS